MDASGQGLFRDVGRTIRLCCILRIQAGRAEARWSIATTAKASGRITYGQRYEMPIPTFHLGAGRNTLCNALKAKWRKGGQWEAKRQLQ
jgi:hypothetical protein